MEGAAPKTPFVDRPPGLGGNMRSSRRVRGEDPSILDGSSMSAAVKKLALGGKGGRSLQDATEWHLHGPKKPEQSTTEEAPLFEGRYRLVDLDRLKETLNSMACACPEDDDSRFAQYCIKNDTYLSKNRMQKLMNGWKVSESKKKQKKKITINDNSLGFATSLELQCENCKSTTKCKAKECKKYKGTCYDGKLGDQEICSWYEMNINLVIASIASGIGPSEMETFSTSFRSRFPSLSPTKSIIKLQTCLGRVWKRWQTC